MTAREWLEKAKKEKFAIGAFNVGNLETFRAIAQAAKNKRSPVIVESSPGETKWMDSDNVVDMARNYSAEYGVPILVNLDHAIEFADCEDAISAGYDLIHLDGSKLSYDENVALTKRVVELVKQHGLVAEGELDHIGGSSTVHEGKASDEAEKVPMTEPERAAEFVKATGIDVFAAFIGNIHGLYLGETKRLDIERLKKINEVTGVFLSLHGSSGISDKQIREAIANGIVKVNLNTEIRQIYKDTLEKALKENPKEYAMYKVEQPVLDEIQRLVEYKIELFGSNDKI